MIHVVYGVPRERVCEVQSTLLKCTYHYPVHSFSFCFRFLDLCCPNIRSLSLSCGNYFRCRDQWYTLYFQARSYRQMTRKRMSQTWMKAWYPHGQAVKSSTERAYWDDSTIITSIYFFCWAVQAIGKLIAFGWHSYGLSAYRQAQLLRCIDPSARDCHSSTPKARPASLIQRCCMRQHRKGRAAKYRKRPAFAFIWREAFSPLSSYKYTVYSFDEC